MLAFITIFSCMSGALFGYDLGLIGGALEHIKESMGVGDGMAEVIVGAAKLGAVAGTFLGAALMLFYGRRPAIAIDSIFFIAGPLIMASAWNVAGLIVGRLVVGVGIGISAVVVPSYLGEVAPSKVRGRVVELYEVMLCLGMLSAALMDAALDNVPGNWRWMVGAPAVPAVIMALAVYMIPESPRWLVIHGQMEQALGVIHKVHTSSTLPTGIHASTAEVEAELMELWSAVENDRVAAASQQLHMHSPTKMHQQPPQHRPTGGSPANGWPAKYRETSGNGASGGTGGPGGCGAGLPPAPRPPHARTASRGNGLDLNRAGSSASEGGGFVNEGEVLGIPAQLTRIRTRSSELMYELGEDELKAVLGPDRAHSSGVDSHHSDSPLPPYSSLDLAGDPEVGGGHTQNMARLQQETVLGFWGTAWQMIKDIGTVARGPESAAFRMALVLAFFNQAFASTAIVNYAPAVLLHAGVESGATAALFTSLIGVSKLVGVTIAFFLVDSLGRRQLLVWGSVGCTASLGLLVPADLLDSHWMLVLGMCAFILSFSLSWAGVFWVLLSEMFSMAAKSPAAAAATAALFLTGAGADLLFLTIHNAMGAFAFLVYAAIAAAAAVYVLAAVPETKGRTLKEVQDLLRGPQRCDGRASLIGTEKEVLVPAGAFQSSSALELRQL